jgi:hypothetical protein
MASKQPQQPQSSKRYYTAAEANATLPLVRAILRDITELGRDLQDRQERMSRIRPSNRARMSEAYEEEWKQLQTGVERDQERLVEFADELKNLGIELKDPYTGLIDFPCWMEGREVYLCWRLGEPEVAYWHELDAGFAGRRKLPRNEAKSQKSEAKI